MVPRLVLFVCRHGAAKSVLASAELERIAEASGIDIKARAGGVEPDNEMAPAVLALLPDKASPIGAERPRRVTADDIQASWLTVTFNLEASALPARPRRTLAWNDVPSVSERPADARDVIDRHILELLESLTRGGAAG
jgi:arsenate reductase (thioredoxin)